MTLIKYNPNTYKPTFNSFIDRFFNDELFGANGNAGSFSPRVDIAETENEFEVQFHVPGMNKKDISIEVKDDRLTVSGERKMEEKKEGKNYHSVESYYGTFSRSFYLPDTANTDKIDASYRDGILHVIIPKDEKKTAKKTIQIK